MKTLKNSHLSVVLILFIGLFSDCKTETIKAPEITLDKQEIQFTYASGTNQLVITTNLHWTASGSQDFGGQQAGSSDNNQSDVTDVDFEEVK